MTEPVVARPIRVARESIRAKRAGDPPTALGVGSVRVFQPLRASMPPAPKRSVRARHAWLALLVLAGFVLGGLIALVQHARVARVPPALPVALPAAQPTVAPPVIVEPARDIAPPSAAIVERRAAVDALLAGRTRAALEQYRALLASSRSAAGRASDAAAIEQVVTLLARELQACEQEAGTPCGF